MDKMLGLEKDLVAWKTAREVLGITRNLSPTCLNDEKDELTRNPAKIASHINKFFLEKVKKLRVLTNYTTPKCKYSFIIAAI